MDDFFKSYTKKNNKLENFKLKLRKTKNKNLLINKKLNENKIYLNNNNINININNNNDLNEIVFDFIDSSYHNIDINNIEKTLCVISEDVQKYVDRITNSYNTIQNTKEHINDINNKNLINDIDTSINYNYKDIVRYVIFI